MIDELKLLKGDDFVIADKIKIHHPTLREICDMGEQRYYASVSTICATPSDYKAILYDEFEVDWEELGEYEFFLMLFSSLKYDDTKLLLPNQEAMHRQSPRTTRKPGC